MTEARIKYEASPQSSNTGETVKAGRGNRKGIPSSKERYCDVELPGK